MREAAPSMRKMALMTMTVMTVMKGAQSCVVQGSGTVECVGGNITEMPSLSPHTTVTLNISQTHIKGLSLETFTNLSHLSKVWIMKNVMLLKIQDFAFANLPALRIIYISENPVLETIGSNAFSNLSALNEIIITKSKHLKSIHSSAFRGLSELQYLTISNTGLEVFPDFSRILSTTSGFLLQLTRNGITEVESDAFNDTRLIRLILTGNHQLSTIHPNAFSGSAGLTLLDVSNTAVRSLPESILEGLETLSAENARQLRTLPPLFGRLRHANLTYHWHCCAFLDSNSTSKWNSFCSQPEAHLPMNRKFYQAHCTKSCNPQPDELNPCTDIMETSPLRVLIWVISLLALLGNATPGQAHRPSFPDVPPGVRGPVHGRVPGRHSDGGHGHAGAVLQPRHCLADGLRLQHRRLLHGVCQRALGLHSDRHHLGALAHHHQRPAPGPQDPAAPRLRRHGGGLGVRPAGRRVAHPGGQQLRQGEHLPADGRGFPAVPGVRGGPAAAQRAGLPGGLRLLPQHLPGGAQALVHAGARRRHRRGAAHGRAHLHRLPVHGAHLLLRHLGRPEAAAHHHVARQAAAGALLPHQLLRQPLPLRLLHAHLPPRLCAAGRALWPLQGAGADLPHRELHLSAARLGLAQEQPRHSVLAGQHQPLAPRTLWSSPPPTCSHRTLDSLANSH
ncbi:follicle-stimulating hormone receptor isoform X3 [Gadus chalcogrammus]|uniref:follicle-stimulating hormone receptor isoform X3 n=1 Tax=Gadus chalcogrammus TaxID=1042646 RepID=UPI0024C4E3C3|nr:follicle-stimulating hormone receptor isoform X3 [Gadus chalcogrammus]